MNEQRYNDSIYTAVSREAWAMLPESSSRPLSATLAQSRNLAHASLETAVYQGKDGLTNLEFVEVTQIKGK